MDDPDQEIAVGLLLESSNQYRKGQSRYSDQEELGGLSKSCVIADMRIVLVEWRIIKGQENLFMDYWSRREVIDDRSGLIGEFLSRVEDRATYSWITCELSPDWTCFVNVGLWRDADAFEAQIGWRLDDNRPKLPFEFEKRRRTFLGPQRWRFGGTDLPATEHEMVL